MRLTFIYCALFLFMQMTAQQQDSLELQLKTVSGTKRLELLSKLTDRFVRTDRKKAWQYFDEFEQLYFSLQEPAAFTALYWHSKGKKLGYDGKVEESISAYKKAEAASAGSKDYKFLWNLNNGFGTTYQEHGNREKALFYFLNAYKIAEAHLEEGSLAGSAMNLGISYAEAGNLQQALSYFKVTHKVYEKGGDGWGYGNILNNIGQIYTLKGQPDSALYYYTKALGVWERTADQAGQAMTHYNLGELFLRKRDYLTAEGHLLMSLQISESINEQYGISMNLASLSALYFDNGNKKKAIEYMEKSIAFARKHDQLKTLKDNYHRKYSFYKDERDYKNALEAHENYFFWYDSLNNSEKHKNLQELLSGFETEKKEKEIEKQKAEIAQKNLLLSEERNREIMLIAGSSVLIIVAGLTLTSLYQHKKKNKIITAREKETSEQKRLLEEKNDSITASLHYARRIQRALISGEEQLKTMFSDYFIFYQPRDIVSGDFYWTATIKNGTQTDFLFAVCDSTGHGVPGAFMSLLNLSFLNQAATEKNISNPALILAYVRSMLMKTIADEDSQDGMDASLMKITMNENRQIISFSFASANSHIWHERNGVVTEMKFDRMPVGKGPNELTPFTLYTHDLQPGDQLYAMSDGYADQFGGPRGKKYKYQSLKKVIEFNSAEQSVVQKERLIENFNNWRGSFEQVDDVCIVGIKI